MSFSGCSEWTLNEECAQMGSQEPAFSETNNQTTAQQSKTASRCDLSNPHALTELPTEILAIVLRLAISPDEGKHAICRLSRVCRVFHHYYHPLLFQDISLLILNIKHSRALNAACIRMQKLCTLINANPSLGGYCKNLKLAVLFEGVECGRGINPQAYYVLLNGLLHLLPNIRSLDIQGEFRDPLTWPFLKEALSTMHVLESLKFEGGPLFVGYVVQQEFDLFLPDVWECVRGLRLQCLELHRVRQQKEGGLGKLPENPAILSTVTDLSLRDFGETPQALESLLQMTGPLQHFSFRPSLDYAYSDLRLWSMERLHGLLSIHCASLKGIAIGPLHHQNPTIAPSTFSFQSFPQLEKLSLAIWNMGGDAAIWNMEGSVTAEDACAALLAPSLQYLVWDFTLPEGLDWSDFGIERRDWILEFAQLAIAQKSALRKVEVVFTPFGDYGSYTNPLAHMLGESFWPRDLIDEVKDSLTPHIELSYNEQLTKEEWEPIARYVHVSKRKKKKFMAMIKSRTGV